MLRKIRIITASAFFVLLTLLFLDFTGTIHLWFGWLAKIQLIPAILAINTGVIIMLILLTLVFGRVYCSVVCPLGIVQDGISNISGRRKGKKNRFRYSKPKTWLRYSVLVVFIASMVLGISAVVSILDPYAAYGRMASNFLAPLYRLGNNLLALIAERMDSYAFYSTEVWIKNWIVFGVAAATLVVIAILAWRHGRTYCNTICPVGTFLGFLSKFSLFRMTFNEEKCTKCKACERGCKSSCIDAGTMRVDHSRCVACFNCIDKCKFGAIGYTFKKEKGERGKEQGERKKELPLLWRGRGERWRKEEGLSRRNILSIIGLLAVSNVLKAQQLHVDGGLAEIEDKKIPKRKTPVVPPGAGGVKDMKARCTACQLCVSSCPNNILRPSDRLETFMQPEMSFEKGYCRPECVECSQVCPSKAINPITTADKSATAIGYAVWIKENCVVNRDDVQCRACERHCPTGAISLIERDPGNEESLKIPVVNKELCIGCGACEYHCPARPFSAIYVEGNLRHHVV